MRPSRVGVALVSVMFAACSATPSASGRHDNGLVTGATKSGSSAPAGDGGPGTTVASGNAATAPAPVRSGSSKKIAGSGPAGGGAAPVTGALADKSTLLIGFYAIVIGSTGLEGAAIGDAKVVSSALTNWVNSHGGLAGHPMKIVMTTNDAASSTPPEQQDQAACATLTEDHHVVAVLSATTTTRVFFDCMANHHTPLVFTGTWTPSDALFSTHPDLFEISPSTDRVGVTMARAAQENGYFVPGAKIGLVYADNPYYAAGAAAYVREAARFGVTIADQGKICQSCSSSEQNAETANIVVRFRSESIDHVVILDGVSSGPYLQAEQEQGYFPRIELSSLAIPAFIALNSAPTALSNALGVGWTPAGDVEEAQIGPGDYSPTRQLCDKIMRDAGQTYNTRLAAVAAGYNCDIFFLLKTIFDRAGTGDASAMRPALESLGTSYVPANGWATYYGPNRHNGIQSYRPLNYSLSCKCWSYVGPERPFAS